MFDACTLPMAERPLRQAEFDKLFTKTVAAERLGDRHLRITLAGDHHFAESVRDLAARETECCSFFTFTVATLESGLVRLDIEVPARHVDVLDALAARAA